ncbi:MAG: hypothetical protein H6719_19180 [Sandaracinaceae bacterium]|nr:hypothetical protein [Sandaracinaceae bacterium]
MADASIRSSLTAHRGGTLSLPGLLRAAASHPSWLVPRDAGGAPTRIAGSAGEPWVCVFGDREAAAAYEASRQVTFGDALLPMTGAALVEALADPSLSLGLDIGSPHEKALFPADLGVLREMATALEVEAFLGGHSNREDGFALLRGYPGFLICAEGAGVMMAPDNQGRRLAAVFTAPDCFDAFRERHAGQPIPAATRVTGQELFTRLRDAPIQGLVFNCAGPVKPKAVAAAFSGIALDWVPDPATAQRLASAAPAVPEGKVAMARGVDALVPRLAPQRLADSQPDVLTRPLVAPDDPTQPIVSPLIVLASLEGGALRYATTKTLGTARLDEVLEAAKQRLATAPPPKLIRFEAIHTGVHRWSGPDAADSLLVPAHLRAIAQACRTTRPVVAVPTRAMGLACASEDSSAVLRMMEAARQTFLGSHDEGLFEHVMLVEDGAVVGRAQFRVDADVIASAPAAVAASPAASPALRARSIEECRVYLQLRGFGDRGREESMRPDGEDVVVEIRYPKMGTANAASFTFRITKGDVAATSGDGPLSFGAGGAPSTLIDPGQFFELAETFSKQGPANVVGLSKERALAGTRVIELAAACMDEVIKFIPAGQDPVPPTAFFTDEGRRSYEKQVSRFSRARLGAIGGAYRKIADQYRAHCHAQGWLYG